MSEKSEMTTVEFLNSLKKTQWYIKNGDKRYQLRVRESRVDSPFVDKNGELFGIKNARINFFVFEKGTNNPAEWVSKYLHDMYIDYGFENPEAEKELDETGCQFDFDLTFCYAFVLYLLKKGNFVITDIHGERVKLPPASCIQ